MYWHLLGQKKGSDSFEYSDDGRGDGDIGSNHYVCNSIDSDLCGNSLLSGRFFSLNKTQGHTFFVDSYFDLGAVSSDFSLSTINGVPLGEREGCIKVRIH